jgi:hypothetical protein
VSGELGRIETGDAGDAVRFQLTGSD